MVHSLFQLTRSGVRCPWGDHPVGAGGGIAESAGADGIPNMKKTKTTTEPKTRIHISREDRARTNAGKTVNSKVRSEGRALAAMERNTLPSRALAAEETKQHLARE